MQQDHSGAIWVLGLLLVIAVAMTSPYWQTVGAAVAGGDVGLSLATKGHPELTSSAGLSGLMLTLGALLLVMVLAGIAQISEGAGAFALVLLLGLWVVFLLGHTTGFSHFFGLFH